MQNVVPRFVTNPGTVRWSAGSIGADNDEIYGRWLGLSDDERRALAEAKVI